MKLAKTILSLSLLFFFQIGLFSQVDFRMNVTGYKSNSPLYATSYSEKDKKTISLKDGKGTLELIKYNQYVIVIYQKNRKPYIVSVDTDNPPSSTTLNISLLSGKSSPEDYRPQKHYASNNGRFSTSKFDLDKVVNKGAFAYQMQSANKEIKNYYSNNVLPKITKDQKKYASKETMRKSEHLLGQEIYKLLGKKRALELDIERIKKKGFSNVSDNASTEQLLTTCEADLKLLRREKQYAKISKELAERELEKVKILINRKSNSGQDVQEKELIKAEDKFNLATKKHEVADLNFRNSFADCWSIRLKSEINNSTNEKEKQIREIEISNIRIQQRKDNALKLNRLHNDLATKLTGRQRWVELANAQKFASDHTKAKVLIAVNRYRKLKIEDAGTGKLQKKIKSAQLEIKKREEIAYQAEMGYLEHMWHLRDKDDLDKRFVDDLYARQSQLLELEKFEIKKNTEEMVEGYNPLSSILEKAEALFNNSTKITEGNDERGQVKIIDVFNDHYEIVIKTNGNKEYYKNGKAITGLTYRFETIRIYGEYLDKVRVEEKDKKKFLDFFKKKTDL